MGDLFKRQPFFRLKDAHDGGSKAAQGDLQFMELDAGIGILGIHHRK